MTASYSAFLESKTQLRGDFGFAPIWMPDFLFDFQSHLVEWALRRGRGALFADCGLGKTPMSLVWAENVVRKTNRPVLVGTPLAVSYQTVREAEKFGVDAVRSVDGTFPPGARIVVTNYERLDRFDPADFAGMVAGESSVLKNFDGTRRKVIQEFMRPLPYRLLESATAAPNDYFELGTSSEALGELGYMDMLMRFFKNEQNTIKPMVYRQRGSDFGKLRERAKWRFRGHAEEPFWRWVCSWARAVRKPSDLGFDDRAFILPPLETFEHVVEARRAPSGMLFDLPAVGMREEREERRRTLQERCEAVAKLVAASDQALVWCHLNPEGDLLARLIDGAVQVKGSDSDEAKEEALMAFAAGEVRVLVTKPKIGAWGLNLQRCAHVAAFPSHSYEQFYQGIRRCWRFGQTRRVRLDMVATAGERGILQNLQRKSAQCDRMFTALVRHMNDALGLERPAGFVRPVEAPAWL